MPQPIMEDANSNTNNEVVTTIGNFDVLLEEAPRLHRHQQQQLRLRTQTQHVGNNRFQVLVTMHKKEYETAVTGGENTTPIVDRIISIVCKQVKPNGRFILFASSTWTALSLDETADFVRSQLDQAANLSTHRGGGVTLDRRATMAAAQPVSLPHVFHQHQQQRAEPSHRQPIQQHQRSPLDFQLEPTPFAPGPAGAAGGAAMDDDTKKRRRRSSLLRRSMSESVLSFSNDKKKALRQHSLLFQGDDDVVANAALAAAAALAEEEEAEQHQQPFVGEGGPNASFELPPYSLSPLRRFARSDSFEDKASKAVTTTAEALDVIFTASANRPSRTTIGSAARGNNSNMLVPSHTGNNRLFVLMNVQMGRYTEASSGNNSNSEQERNELVDGLRETVGKHWGGRFLQETQDLSYRLLSPTEASELLMKAWDERAGLPPRLPSTIMTGDNSNYMAAAVASDLDDSLSSLNSAGSGSYRRPSHVKRETLSALHGPAGDHLRKTARDSLQKKKKRLGVTSRLAALTRSTSEPIRNHQQGPGQSAFSLGDSFSSLTGPGGDNNADLFPAAAPQAPPRMSIGNRSESAPIPIGMSSQRARPPNSYNNNSSTGFSPMKPRFSVRGSLAGLTELSEGQINDLISTLEVGDASAEMVAMGSASTPAAAAANEQQQSRPQQAPSPFSRGITATSSSDSLTSPFLDKRASVALSELTDGQVKDLLASLDVTDDDGPESAPGDKPK